MQKATVEFNVSIQGEGETTEDALKDALETVLFHLKEGTIAWDAIVDDMTVLKYGKGHFNLEGDDEEEE